MEFCKRKLLSERDQIILDEIFLRQDEAIDKDDLISTLENRFISGV